MVEKLIRSGLSNKDLTRPFGWDSKPREKHLLWLDKNENVDRIYNDFISELALKIDKESITCYPEPANLYRKLSNLEGVPKESLILTPGSDGAISNTFNVFINLKDKVLITCPSFAMYEVYCRIFNADTHFINYARDLVSPSLSIDNLLSTLKKVKPKLFCLPNPDSPTGAIMNSDDIDKIIKFCAELNTIILVDEAYYPYYDFSVSKKTLEFKNLIVARTFSKAWGLAGLRLGYAIGNPDTIRYFHKIKPMYEIGSYSIAFIEKVLDCEDKMRDSVKRIMDGKKYFIDELNKMNFQTLKSEGNFLHVNFGSKSKEVHDKLEKKVLYRKSFTEECLRGYSRFTATTKENFDPIIKIIMDQNKK